MPGIVQDWLKQQHTWTVAARARMSGVSRTTVVKDWCSGILASTRSFLQSRAARGGAGRDADHAALRSGLYQTIKKTTLYSYQGQLVPKTSRTIDGSYHIRSMIEIFNFYKTYFNNKQKRNTDNYYIIEHNCGALMRRKNVSNEMHYFL